MPKISVIIPVYNVEKYLPRCIESVLNQTFTDFEVICVNDASPDNCAIILERYASLDKRVQVIKQPINQGLSVARNTGVSKATGEYICFVDSDDVLHNQCLEVVYKLAKKHSADLVNFRLESMEFESSIEKELLCRRIDINSLDLKVSDKPIFLGTHREKYKIDFNACGKLYKRKILEDISFIPKIHFEDFPHTFAVLSKGPKTVVINEVLYIYTVNNDSIFHQKNNPQQIRDYHRGIVFIYEIFKQPGLEEELKFLTKNFIPNILLQQLSRCRRSNKIIRPQMYKVFAEELKDLDEKGLLCWNLYAVLKCYFYIKKNSW